VVKIGKNAGLFFGALVLVGFGIVAIGFLETPFPDIIPLSLLAQNPSITCEGVECRLAFNRGKDSFDGSVVFESLNLLEVDTNLPIVLDFQINAVNIPVGCESEVDNDGKVNINAFSTRLGSGDGTGGIPSVITTINEGITDIQPLLTEGLDFIHFELVGGECSTGSILYGVTQQDGGGGAVIDFTQRPPEIREFSNPLLAQNDFLLQEEFTESATNFAVAESFQLRDPTVITDIKIRIGSQDRVTEITAFVWNLDTTPPERVVQASETFSGITFVTDLDFSFPNAVVLMPTENDIPINYAVGIRVDKNLDQSFIYTRTDQTARTHGAVIDRNPTLDGETMFVDNGIIGIDIFHSQVLAEFILDKIPDIPIEIIEPDPLTQEELVAILCEGIEPEPEICQGINTANPTADQCGITEIFFNGECLCAPNYDRNALGSCEIRDTTSLPDLLQIGGFSFLLLVVIGVIIILVGITGIIVRRRR